MSTRAQPVRDPEYDRFGPWVVEIDEEDPPPPLFEPYLTRADEPLISVKIPRKIARREAHPGMDLYDYMVSLYEADLVVLQRVGTEVRERTIAYADIGHLSVHEELLRGGLHLGVPGDPYTLPYNTASSDVMQRVIEIIRGRAFAGRSSVARELPETPAPAELSFYFERLLRDEQAVDPELRVLAAQPNLGLGATETSLARRILFGLVDKRLLESLHLSDGRELRVLDRGRPFAYRWQTIYGRRETIIPVANVTDASLVTGDDDVSTLAVRTKGGESSWNFHGRERHLEAYLEWLKQA